MSKLELLAQVDFAARCVTLQDNYSRAYVGVVWPDTQVVILDIAHPTQPKVIGQTAPISDIPLDVAIEGDRVYVIQKNGLHIFDASIHHRPEEVSFYPISSQPLGIAVLGKYAYIATGKGGLLAIDVSEPSNPRQVYHCELPGYTYGVALGEDYIYVSGWGGLFILNYLGSKLSYFRTPKEAYGVVITGKYAYVASNGAGLRIIDISNPFFPEEVGYCKTGGWAIGVATAGNYAYLADGTAVRIIDVSKPSRPVEIEHYYASPMGTSDIAISGNYIYVADSKGLVILRFTR